MPTRRMIDPCLWQSETIASLTRNQRLLFIGLFSNADDQGRLRAHPALVRSLVFPYDDIAVEEIQADMQAIAESECILLYEVEEKECLQIINWWKYQSPQWAYPSKIPAPEGWQDRLRYRHDNHVIKENWDEPLPNALPKALPKEPPNGQGRALDCGHRVRVSSKVSTELESGADAPPADAGPDEPCPSTFPEWQEYIRAAKGKQGGRQAAIRRMIDVLYPGLDPPAYNYIASTARKVGGFGRLADLLWQNSTRPPTGDLLAYIQGVAKNGSHRTGTQKRRTVDRVVVTGVED